MRSIEFEYNQIKAKNLYPFNLCQDACNISKDDDCGAYFCIHDPVDISEALLLRQKDLLNTLHLFPGPDQKSNEFEFEMEY